MLAEGAARGFAFVPTIYAGAVPSGLVSRAALDHVVGRICAGAEAGPVDGALLALHGAMVAEGIDEADAWVARQVREAVGPDCPIVATFDSHANLTPALVEAVDVLVGYDTLPHVDMGERGREAAALLARLLAGEARPAACFVKVPLLSVPQTQATTGGPMGMVSALRAELERDPAIWTCSAVMGFPYCDVPHLGMAALAYGARGAAAAAAERIAARMWELRRDFLPELVPVERAAALAIEANAGPFVLVEPADNVGGGAPGDGTHLLRALLARGARGGNVVLWDAEAARRAAALGVGARFRGAVGGKTLPLHGAPVEIDGTITFAGPVRYRRDLNYMRGQEIDLGLCAAVSCDGLRVVLTGERAMPFDLAHWRAVGIDPAREKLVTMKCGSMWAGILGDLAADFRYVDTDGICSSNVERMPFTRLDRALFPLVRDLDWRPEVVEIARA
jgi:microcystin degradation protein MlrC